MAIQFKDTQLESEYRLIQKVKGKSASQMAKDDVRRYQFLLDDCEYDLDLSYEEFLTVVKFVKRVDFVDEPSRIKRFVSAFESYLSSNELTLAASTIAKLKKASTVQLFALVDRCERHEWT